MPGKAECSTLDEIMINASSSTETSQLKEHYEDKGVFLINPSLLEFQQTNNPEGIQKIYFIVLKVSLLKVPEFHSILNFKQINNSFNR